MAWRPRKLRCIPTLFVFFLIAGNIISNLLVFCHSLIEGLLLKHPIDRMKKKHE